MRNKRFTIGIAVLLLVSLASIGCDNDATGQDDSGRVDFLQNVTSGSVVANTDGRGFLLQLEVSPNTSYIAESPGFEAGTIRTENFFNLYFDIFGDFSPNSILALRDNGTAVSVPIALSDPNYDSETGIIEFTAIPVDLNQSADFSTMSIQNKSIDELGPSFGSAFLFIDSGELDPGGILGPGGILDPNGGTCSDGANVVCPSGLGSDPCINTGAGGQCCVLGGDVTCSNCVCN